jgi:hypothetical protein
MQNKAHTLQHPLARPLARPQHSRTDTGPPFRVQAPYARPQVHPPPLPHPPPSHANNGPVQHSAQPPASTLPDDDDFFNDLDVDALVSLHATGGSTHATGAPHPAQPTPPSHLAAFTTPPTFSSAAQHLHQTHHPPGPYGAPGMSNPGTSAGGSNPTSNQYGSYGSLQQQPPHTSSYPQPAATVYNGSAGGTPPMAKAPLFCMHAKAWVQAPIQSSWTGGGRVQ